MDIVGRVLVSLFISAVILPAGALAQDSSAPEGGGAQLELRQSELPVQKGRRPIVRPAPAPGRAAREAEQALSDFESGRQKNVQDDATPRPPRRPDLGYDVTSGIQQQNIQRALRP